MGYEYKCPFCKSDFASVYDSTQLKIEDIVLNIVSFKCGCKLLVKQLFNVDVITEFIMINNCTDKEKTKSLIQKELIKSVCDLRYLNDKFKLETIIKILE